MAWNDVLARAKAQRQAQIDNSGQAMPADYSSVSGVQRAGDQQIAQQTAYGDRATQDYLGAAENFDASKALNKYATGAWGSISTALGHQLDDLSGSAVGAGRFDSGFFDQDKGVVVNRALSQFSNDIAGQSMNAAGLQQRNTESLGSFANERTGMGNDLLAARSEQVQNDARAEAERQRKKKGGLLSGIGTAIGYGLGGPVGGAVGGAIGSYAGG
jgi:hypothetical protein